MNKETSITPARPAMNLAVLKTRELASGGVSIALMPKKEFGVKHGLKGAALNKAHFDYKREQMLNNGASVAALLAGGKIGITRYSANAKGIGGSLGWVDMSSVKEPKEPKARGLASATVEELEAALAARRTVTV